MPGYGINGHIGFAKETSGGTPVAASNYVVGISEDVSASIDRFEPINIHGKYAEPDDYAGVRRIGGNIVMPAMATQMGFFLLGAMGLQSNTVILSGMLSRHEFRMATSDWDAKFANRPFTFEIFRDVGSSHQYAGCNISQLQIGNAPNQEVRMTAGIIGKSVASIAKTTPAYTSSPSAPFTFDTASISIGGSGIDKCEAFNLTINNQLSGVPTLNNSSEISRIRRNGPQIVRLSGTMSFEDFTEYDDFIAQTERQITISVRRASSFQMIIDIPRFVYTAYPVGIPGRDRMTVSFDGTARYSTTSASSIKIDLYNTTSGY